MNFKPGEIVRRNNGWTPLFIVAMSPAGQNIRARYCGSSDEYDQIYRPDQIKLVVNEDDLGRNKVERLTPSQRAQLRRQMHPDYQTATPDNEREPDMSKALYQTNETPARFCTLLARNSEGNLVLEVRGTSEVIVRKMTEVTEVRPYTVQLKNTNRGGTDHAIAVKGSVEVGDFVARPDGYVWQVVRVDTKSTTSQSLKGRKLLTEVLPEVEHADDLIDKDFIPDDEDDDSL